MDNMPVQTPWIPQPGQHMNGNMVVMTDPENEIIMLEANFRGQIIDDKGQAVKKFEPLMNENGVNKIIGMLRTIVNRVTFMTNIDKKLVYGFMEHYAETLALELMVNKPSFGIRSDADRDAIYFQCLTLAYIAIMRGHEGDDKRFWKGTVQEMVYSGMNGGDGKGGRKGFLDRVTPGAWK